MTGVMSIILLLMKRQNNDIPLSFELNQNYPNPFNPTTIINYSIARRTNVKIIIFDALGRKVTTLVNEEKSPGNYTLRFNAAHLASGVYFCHMRAGSFLEAKKLVLIK